MANCKGCGGTMTEREGTGELVPAAGGQPARDYPAGQTYFECARCGRTALPCANCEAAPGQDADGHCEPCAAAADDARRRWGVE